MGGDLDVVIEGEGYLEVILLNGIVVFICDGGLKWIGDGLIVILDGYLLVFNIIILNDVNFISINGEGEVYVYFMDCVELEFFG